MSRGVGAVMRESCSKHEHIWICAYPIESNEHDDAQVMKWGQSVTACTPSWSMQLRAQKLILHANGVDVGAGKRYLRNPEHLCSRVGPQKLRCPTLKKSGVGVHFGTNLSIVQLSQTQHCTPQ